MPLSGDPSVTSGFGYRADPFLGRLAFIRASISPKPMELKFTPLLPAASCMPAPRAGMETWSRSIMATGSRPGTRTCRKRGRRGPGVAKVAVLGRLGSTGRSTGPHLHYEVRVDGEPVDPERYLRAGADLAAAE